MWRRDFLKILPLICWAPYGSQGQDQYSSACEIHFYLAGARYYKPRRPIKAGQLVSIVQEAFENKACFGILDEAGDRIGYVPKDLISVLEHKHILDSRISSVHEFALPWRRYRVRILVADFRSPGDRLTS
jgi:hypothetical protein